MNTAPSTSAKPGMTQRERRYVSLSVCIEDLLDGVGEVARERDRKRQRRRVPLGLDGVNGLPRDAHRLGELPLGQPRLAAELADPVSHVCKASLTSAECQACF